MVTFISILLIGFLGFSGCSSSDAESSPAYNVQAIGMVNGSELSVNAYVMDQEERLSSDAMITINGGPMNIGFFSAQDLNNEGEDSLTDNNPTVQGVPSGDFQPFYFLDSFDLNEVDTVNFVATGRTGTTLLTSSNVVPERITLLEPSTDATFLTGEEVYIKWEGGDPYGCFEVSYSWGSEYESDSSGWLQDTYDYTIGTDVINEPGLLFIFVRARSCADTQEEGGAIPGTSNVVYEAVVSTVTPIDDRAALSGNTDTRQLHKCLEAADGQEATCRNECRKKGGRERSVCMGRCKDKEEMNKFACGRRYCDRPESDCRNAWTQCGLDPCG